MIATYIQELLATNNRVIVPNYGAFLVRATSKSKDATTLKEKLKDIYFSPFLKFNDELLEKYIIEKENVSKEQAAEKIEKFIDEIKKTLDEEKPYEIKDFGSFTADKQGKVQFVTVIKEETQEDNETTPKTSATKAEPVKEKKETPKQAAKAKKEPEKKEPKKEIQEDKKETKQKEDTLKKEKTVAPVKKQEEKTTPVSNETKQTVTHTTEKKTVNKGLVLAIAIGVPLAAVFVWALLNFSTIKKVLNKEKTKTEKVTKKKINKKTTAVKKVKTNAKKSDNTNKEQKTETEVAKTEKKEQTAKQQKPVVLQKKYYIIAGSFKNEKYALTYMEKLKEEGYKAEKLKERNGMHAVSYNSFVDKRKAIAEYKFLAQEKGLPAWILYY